MMAMYDWQKSDLTRRSKIELQIGCGKACSYVHRGQK